MAHIDVKLLTLCKNGNIEAQMEFYNTLFMVLFATANRIVGNRAQAEDIVQESFIKIFDKIDKYIDHPPAIEYALRRIVINGSIDFLRRQKFQFVDVENAACVESDEDLDEQALQVERIKAALEKLAPGFKLIFTLRLIENMDFEDIADQLNITPSSVRSQYIRAKQKIRDLI